jgi:type I restriction enzyme M protein
VRTTASHAENQSAEARRPGRLRLLLQRRESPQTQRDRSFQGLRLRRSAQARQGELDIFWLKDESLEDSANLPDPDVIAAEIAEDRQAALDQFVQIAVDLKR